MKASAMIDDPAIASLRNWLWPEPVAEDNAAEADSVMLLSMHPSGQKPRCGTVISDGLDLDSLWHYHDMHQLVYAFESAVVVESKSGKHLIPRQLAAWIPAGVVHRLSFRAVRSVSVFFRPDRVTSPGEHIRTLLVSPLMREMLQEARRWPLESESSTLRNDYFRTMAGLCNEWIEKETDLLLPSCQDCRLQRALDYTVNHLDTNVSEVCQHAGISDRSLRRLIKAETGFSWESYRQRVRLLRAVALLGETDRAIGDIALSCGFEHQSAFARRFRQAMGESPREYRRRCRY